MPKTVAEEPCDPILFWNDKGEYFPLSVEEVSSRGLNKFYGWSCTAGVTSICVDFDGEIRRAACHIGGSYGNIYSDFEIPTDPISCERSRCVCGADIAIPKYRYRDQPVELDLDAKPSKGEYLENSIAVTGASNFSKKAMAKSVMWIVGRRCNYECSYCNDNSHSKTEPFPLAKQLMTSVEKVLQKFSRGVKTQFYFAGGEPTLYPGFLEVVKMLHGRGCPVSVSTNGSRSTEYFSDLLKYSSIAFSVHFDFFKTKKFQNMIEALVLKKIREYGSLSDNNHWIDIKLMVQPNRLEEAKKFARSLKGIPFMDLFVSVHFQMLWVKNNCYKDQKYSAEELDFFKVNNRQKGFTNSKWRVDQGVTHFITRDYRTFIDCFFQSPQEMSVFAVKFYWRNFFVFKKINALRWEVYNQILPIRRACNWMIYKITHPRDFVKLLHAYAVRIGWKLVAILNYVDRNSRTFLWRGYQKSLPVRQCGSWLYYKLTHPEDIVKRLYVLIIRGYWKLVARINGVNRWFKDTVWSLYEHLLPIRQVCSWCFYKLSHPEDLLGYLHFYYGGVKKRAIKAKWRIYNGSIVIRKPIKFCLYVLTHPGNVIRFLIHSIKGKKRVSTRK